MNILIVEDNVTIAENIALYFQSKGNTAFIAKDGEEGFEAVQKCNYDFLIVDRMMPKIDGLSLIRMLHARGIHIPFLFLTALGKQTDKIEGLALGADDYLVKPFDLLELELRITNILKRKGVNTQSSHTHITFSCGIEIDTASKIVKKEDCRVDLSPKEYALFEILVKNRGKILNRDFLYESVWGEYDVSGDMLDTINVHIAHLRRKLDATLIRTVKLSGYIIDLE